VPAYVYLLLDVADDAVFADVDGMAGGKLSIGMEDSHRGSNGFIGVAEDGIIRVQALGELGVLLDRVAACGEIGDVKFLDELTAVTQRFALLCSATGKGHRIPGDHDSLLALELSEGIFLAVRSGHLEIRRGIADSWRGMNGCDRQTGKKQS
jgi:hypothetical protein